MIAKAGSIVLRCTAPLACLLSIATPTKVHAWDLVVFGRVVTIEFANNTPGDIRVYLDNSGLSSCVNAMAYISTSTANYQAMAAGLMTARAQNLPVELRINISGGFCAINDFVY